MSEDHYSDIASRYETYLGKVLYPMRKNIRTFIKHRRYHTILDLCCGTGKQLEMMAADDMELCGVDSSIAMLAQADKSKNIQFLAYNATEIELTDESYDAIILSLALHEKNRLDRDVILQKSWKYLRPGGHLIVADYCQVPRSMRSALISNLVIKYMENTAGKRHYDNYLSWMDNGALENHIQHYGTRKEIISYHFCGTLLSCAIYKQKADHSVFQLLS